MQIHGFEYRCSDKLGHVEQIETDKEDGRATMSKPFSIKDKSEFATHEDFINSRFITISQSVLEAEGSMVDPQVAITARLDNEHFKRVMKGTEHLVYNKLFLATSDQELIYVDNKNTDEDRCNVDYRTVAEYLLPISGCDKTDTS